MALQAGAYALQLGGGADPGPGIVHEDTINTPAVNLVPEYAYLRNVRGRQGEIL